LNTHWHVGQIIKLVSWRKLSPRSGYGVLRDDAGREVFFAPELLAGAQGFDDLHRGQLVEFTFDEPFLRAASIHPLQNRPQAVPAAV